MAKLGLYYLMYEGGIGIASAYDEEDAVQLMIDESCQHKYFNGSLSEENVGASTVREGAPLINCKERGVVAWMHEGIYYGHR